MVLVTSHVTINGITYRNILIAKAHFCADVGLVALDGEKYVVRFLNLLWWVATRRIFE